MLGSAKLVKNRPICRYWSILMYEVAGEKATGRRQIGRFFTNFADPTYREKPKNRKLPFVRLSICKIIHAGRVGQFPIFGYSLY
jgi:hypothetical protein